MKHIKAIKVNYLFMLLSGLYFLTRLYFLKSDFNIFSPAEVYAPYSFANLDSLSVFSGLTQLLRFFIPRSFVLLPQRLISVFAGFLAGVSLYLYANYKRLPKKELILLLFWFSPLVYYYSRVGQSSMLGLSLLMSAFFLYPVYKNQIIALSLFTLAVLVSPYLAIFIISFYLMFNDKYITILEQITYFSLPAILFSLLSPYQALLLLSPVLAITIVYLLAPISVFIPLLILFSLLPLTYQAYQSTTHASLIELGSKLNGYLRFYQYPVYTTFNKDELSLFWQRPLNWLELDLKNGGLLVTDDLATYQLDSKDKERAFLIYQNQISQKIQVFSTAHPFSYFPAKKKQNTYRIYLILSQADYDAVFPSQF